MGNLTCVIAQTRPGQEVICETNGHIYNYEMGALAALAGVLPRVVNGEDGMLTWDAIAPAIRPSVYYRPQTALICLENTVNMAGGTVHPTADRRRDLRPRARARHSRSPRRRQGVQRGDLPERAASPAMTRKFDSVQFCLSKGLGAPVGSMIVGTREFIERCRPIRKMLGGGMRQAGVLAAAGLVALRAGPEASAGRSRQRAGSGAAPGAHAGHRPRRVESSHEHRHLQREAERAVVRRLPRADCGARRPGGSRGCGPRPHGDASRREPVGHRKSG